MTTSTWTCLTLAHWRRQLEQRLAELELRRRLALYVLSAPVELFREVAAARLARIEAEYALAAETLEDLEDLERRTAERTGGAQWLA